jgi:hypothetical protein
MALGRTAPGRPQHPFGPQVQQAAGSSGMELRAGSEAHHYSHIFKFHYFLNIPESSSNFKNP